MSSSSVVANNSSTVLSTSFQPSSPGCKRKPYWLHSEEAYPQLPLDQLSDASLPGAFGADQKMKRFRHFAQCQGERRDAAVADVESISGPDGCFPSAPPTFADSKTLVLLR